MQQETREDAPDFEGDVQLSPAIDNVVKALPANTAQLKAFMASQQLDVQEEMASLRVPANAGEHEDALRRILMRIPRQWGRFLSLGPGWYPIIIELDKQLSALDPDYEIQQIKEKMGGLRYYCEPSSNVPGLKEPVRPAQRLISDLLVGKDLSLDQSTGNKEVDDWRLADDMYSRIAQAFWESEEGERVRQQRSDYSEQMHALVREAERKASRTCEGCGGHNLVASENTWAGTACVDCG